MYKDLPSDITSKIKKDFTGDERNEVQLIFTETYSDNHNVGTILQALRAVLILSGGDLEKLKNFCVPYLSEDPRDLIMDAEEIAGDPKSWFADDLS